MSARAAPALVVLLGLAEGVALSNCAAEAAPILRRRLGSWCERRYAPAGTATAAALASQRDRASAGSVIPLGTAAGALAAK